MNKKILVIINNLGIGGAERLVVSDIKEMLKIGIDVELITLKNEPKESFLNELILDNSKFRCIAFKHMLDIRSWLNLVHAIRMFNPDLVVTHLWYANTIGRIASTVALVPSIIVFEQNVYDTLKTRKMFLMDWCLQFLSTKIIAVSNAVKKSLIRHGIREVKIDVLHNSVDLSRFSANNDKHNIRADYNIPKEAFVYVFIGRLIYQKAVDVLIEAFRNLDEESFLLIAGQGLEKEFLENMSKEYGLERRAVFIGVQNDIPALFSSSDCFVLPSRYEGLPLVLTEALAASMPVIVSDFEAAKELITHEKNGLIVPIENPQSLAEAMIRVKDDIALRNNLKSGAKKSIERFSIYQHVRDILRYTKAKI